MMKVSRLDPLAEWRDLVDQIERRRIEQVTGDARRAQDLYDASEVLRLWHRNITGEGNLTEEWHETTHFGPTRREVNKRRYGFEILRGNRAALPGILDGFGLYRGALALSQLLLLGLRQRGNRSGVGEGARALQAGARPFRGLLAIGARAGGGKR